MRYGLAIRIVESPPRYPPFVGGVESVSQAVATRLCAGGDEVVVVCADEPRGAPTVVDGIPVRRLAWRLKLANTNITPGLPLALLREPFDVVHAHIPTPWSGDIAVLTARLLRRGSVVFFHNAIVGEGMNGLVARLYNATVLRATLRLADRVAVISDRWRDYLIDLEPSVAAKISVVPNGVDLECFTVGTPGDGHKFLFVGILDRFHRYKGLDVLLNAVAALEEPFELTVIGDGELRAEYEAQRDRLGLEKCVHFVGRVDDEMLGRAYRESDVYILPSDFAEQEGGYTLTALEAMASGMPVVLAEGAGQLAVEADAHGAGLRVAAGDVAGLADALRRLMNDDALRASMASAARRFVEERHSWDVIVARRRELSVEAAELARNRRSRATLGSPADG